MNVFKQIRARLTGVLGHDCSGKPLRKGDRVEPALPPEVVKDECQCVMEVAGIEPNQSKHPGHLELRLPSGRMACALPKQLRKVSDDDQAVWENITEVTGWAPKTVKHDEEVPA